MVVTWWLTIFGFGWIGLNELRLVIVTKIATGEATKLLTAKKRTATENCCTSVLIPLESIEIALDIKYMRQIVDALEKDDPDEEGVKDGKDGEDGKGTEGAKVVKDEGKKKN